MDAVMGGRRGRDAGDAEYERLYPAYERAYAAYEEAHRRYAKAWKAEQPKLNETLLRLSAEKQELQARRAALFNAEVRLPRYVRRLREVVGGSAAVKDLERQILAKQDAYQNAGSRAYRRARVAFERAEAAVQRHEDRLVLVDTGSEDRTPFDAAVALARDTA